MVLSEIFPNGASSRQLDKLRNSWFDKYGNPFTDDIEWPKDIDLMDYEMSALGMLASCFAYGGVEKFTRFGVPCRPNTTGDYYHDYLRDYLNHGGTQEEFDKMICIQTEHLKRSSVISNVHTDFEGCTYNGISEVDEECLLV